MLRYFFVLLFILAFCTESYSQVYGKDVLQGKDYTYLKKGEQLSQISLPMGGIGAGSIGLSGNGGLIDFSIYGEPNLTSSDIWGSDQCGFAILKTKGTDSTIRLVEGLVQKSQIYLQGIKGQGFISSGVEGLPHFETCTIKTQYPIGVVYLHDDKVPIDVELTGYNPFIPLDDKNSSLPCAILEYKLTNRTSLPVEYEFSYNLSNFCGSNPYETGEVDTRSEVFENGIKFYNTINDTCLKFGSSTLSVLGEKPIIKGMWLRSSWQWDWLSALWRELSTSTFTANNGSNGIDTWGRNGGSVLLKGELKPKDSKVYKIVITWHFPNRKLVQSYKKPCDTCDSFVKQLTWQPFYTSMFKNALEVEKYVEANYTYLRNSTFAFTDALFSTTIPNYVLEAISSNLAIIKSPTLLRQKNGNLWGWEGITPKYGVGPGSNIHVYNYSQSLSRLFPNIEKTLREQELIRSLDSNGHVNFRAALPDGPSEWAGLPAADGQLGGIMKVYRLVSITGDTAWAKSIYPNLKRSLDYCINTWDPKLKGVIEEPHHNTYDIEFWGPDGMNTSVYLGALSSFIEISKLIECNNNLDKYQDLLTKGKEYFEKSLFNGEYFKQNITYTGLKDSSFLKEINDSTKQHGEINKLLRAEGPRYQYGNGCLSDGIIGVWLSDLYQLPLKYDENKIKSHLKSVFSYNFKPDLQAANHACTQRPGYALGHEPGLLLCTWPHNDKPTLPFVYSDEVWTGIEYQVASHAIMHGLIDEGLSIVRGTRFRYDGSNRNPFAEYEFGNYYARAMSSYSLLESLTGITFDPFTKTLTVAPRVTSTTDFSSFFTTNNCYGSVLLAPGKITINVIAGKLDLQNLSISYNGVTRYIKVDSIITSTKEIKY